MTAPELSFDGPGGRWYRDRKQPMVEVPSVTSIQKALSTPALIGWASSEAATFAVDKRDVWIDLDRDEAIDLIKGAPFRNRNRAAGRGADTHDILEAVIKGRPVPDLTGALEGYVRAGRRFMDEWAPETIWCEVTVFNLAVGYAGTLDLICRLPDGTVWLLDWKTGNGVYGSFSLQLSGYEHAEYGDVDGERVELPHIDRCGVIWLRPDGTYRLIPIVTNDETFRSFCSLIPPFFFQRQERTYVMPALSPPADGAGTVGEDWLLWLSLRLEQMRDNDNALAMLARRWPNGVATLRDIRRGEATWTRSDVIRLDEVIGLVETEFSLPFVAGDPRVAEKRTEALADRDVAHVARELNGTAVYIGTTDEERVRIVLDAFGGKPEALTAMRAAAKRLHLPPPKSLSVALADDALVAEALSQHQQLQETTT